jgi:hypothetical protein
VEKYPYIKFFARILSRTLQDPFRVTLYTDKRKALRIELKSAGMSRIEVQQ